MTIAAAIVAAALLVATAAFGTERLAGVLCGVA
jgi:hypothetical protein